MDDRLDVASKAATDGADVAFAGYRRNVDVDTKSAKNDVVTDYDRSAQRAVIETIRESYPEAAVVGEEGDELKEIPESESCWIVDPIDGTSNFVAGMPIWATSVATVANGETVAAVNALPAVADVYATDGEETRLNGDAVTVSDATDPETFTVATTLRWAREDAPVGGVLAREVFAAYGDHRRFGSAQATLSMVAAGQIEAAVSTVVSAPWDTVAGVSMVRAAGGTVTDVEGDRWTPDARGLVASNGAAHDDLVETARVALDEADEYRDGHGERYRTR